MARKPRKHWILLNWEQRLPAKHSEPLLFPVTSLLHFVGGTMAQKVPIASCSSFVFVLLLMLLLMHS